MTAEQRLDTVEDDLDAVKKLLASAARYAESANQGLDRLTERFDGLTVRFDELTAAQTNTQARIDNLTAAQTNTQARIDDLTAAQVRTQALLDQLGTRFDQLGSRVDQLVQSQSHAFVRLDRIERALDTLASNQLAERDARLALREDLEILYQGVQLSEESTDRAISQLTERVNQLTQGLTTSVQDLVGMIGQLANDAAQDRAETRRIWEYLLHQSGNGSSGC